MSSHPSSGTPTIRLQGTRVPGRGRYQVRKNGCTQYDVRSFALLVGEATTRPSLYCTSMAGTGTNLILQVPHFLLATRYSRAVTGTRDYAYGICIPRNVNPAGFGR